MVGHPLPENGYAATFAGERKICTSATDNIIEVSTHPSGVGFERGILAVTHSIRKCYALIPELHRILHGKLIPLHDCSVGTQKRTESRNCRCALDCRYGRKHF